MYLPDAFAERDCARLTQFIDDFPFGLLICGGGAAPLQANAAPFIYDAPEQADAHGGGGVLRAHVARANPLCLGQRVHDVAAVDLIDPLDAVAPDTPVDVLIVFQGPQHYVSPSWYPSKALHGKVVPTWNYAQVQARGRLRFVDDPAWLAQLVGELTERHEAASAQPWSVADAPANYIDGMLRAIVGIEIEVSELVGKFKLSQNRELADQRGVLAGLQAAAADEAGAAGAPRGHSKHDWMQAQLETLVLYRAAQP